MRIEFEARVASKAQARDVIAPGADQDGEVIAIGFAVHGSQLRRA